MCIWLAIYVEDREVEKEEIISFKKIYGHHNCMHGVTAASCDHSKQLFAVFPL